MITKEEKIQKEILNGFIEAGEIKIECYVLDNGMRVISRRGLDKALGLQETIIEHAGKKRLKGGGNELSTLLLSNKIRKSSMLAKYNLEAGFNNFIKFKRIMGGNPVYGFEATFLIDICHCIQDLYNDGFLDEKHKFLYANATIIERAFAKLGIIAYIDEATGYQKKSDTEYRDQWKELLLQEAKKWTVAEFPDELSDMFYKFYPNAARIKKERKLKKHQNFSFFGGLFNKYIYFPLARSNGAILEGLREKNPVIISKNGKKYRKDAFHQWLEAEIAMPILRQHIWKLIGVGGGAINKTHFDRAFVRVFGSNEIETTQQIFENFDFVEEKEDE